MAGKKGIPFQQDDMLKHTAVSALKFMDTYARRGKTGSDRGLEWLLLSGQDEFVIDKLVAPDECLNKQTILPDKGSKSFKLAIHDFEQGMTPHSIYGLRSLSDLGIKLPINYIARQFEYFNVLATLVHFSGSLSDKYGVKYSRPTVDLPRQERLRTLLEFFPAKQTDNYKTLLLTEHGLSVGRLLATMGVVTSRQTQANSSASIKKTYGLEMPPHLLHLATAYATRSTKHMAFAEKLLLDATSVFYMALFKETRLPRLKLPSFRLPSQVSKAGAHRLAIQAIYLLNSVFPEAGYKTAFYTQTSEDRNLPLETPIHTPYLVFSPEANRHMLEKLKTPA